MRFIVRRLLWLGPTLLLITLVTFGVLSHVLEPSAPGPTLPLFFNPDPGAVERLARAAVREVSSGAPVPAKSAVLSELGGAALPIVLPALDSLEPAGRARVVVALRPLAARMGFELDPTWEASREVLFWMRFWEEHSIDYRPLVARRAVLRYADRSTDLRDAEVRQLDTYALDELISQMSPVRSRADVERVTRLAAAAAAVTGEYASRLEPGAGVEQAQKAASGWQDWWGKNRTRYKTYTGTERVTAMLRDTRYGGWVVQAVRHRLGLTANGRPVLDVLVEGARVTLPLVGCGILGAVLAALLGGAVLALERTAWTRVWRLLGLLRAALPIVVLSALFMRSDADAPSEAWQGGVLLALSGVPLAAFQRATEDAVGRRFVRTLRAWGVSRWRASLTALRLSSAGIVVQLGAQLSSLVTLTFVVEYALGLPGLGSQTVEALRHPDLAWLMAITICTALFVGVLQAASELLLGLLDPRAVEPSTRDEVLG